MPRPVGYGRPGTRVIPEQWAATHERIAAGTHNCAMTLRRPAADQTGDHGGFDWDTGRTDPVQGAAYATNVHITITAEDQRDAEATVGEEQVTVPLYRIGLSNHLPCREGDIGEVLASPDDPLLVGRLFRVEQVLLGEHRFERDLLCVLQPAPPADD